MWRHKWQQRLLIVAILLILITACRQRDRDIGQMLIHPAVSLVKADTKLALSRPVWFPGGDQLLVTGSQACVGKCTEDIYTLDLQTGETHLLFQDGRYSPVWTSDPEVIGFVAAPPGQPEGIYMSRLDNDEPQFLARGLLASWSPDGRYVAIADRERPDSDGRLAAYVSILDLTTGAQAKVFETPRMSNADIRGLAWSPTSDLLALSATWSMGAGYMRRVVVVRPDGTDLWLVADSAAEPGWMIDGRWLYFVLGDGKLGFAPLEADCVVVPLDIAGIRSPAISPSGDQIAFEHESNIYLLDLDRVLGSNREKLVCPD